MALQHPPHRGCPDADAKAEQFALDPLVANNGAFHYGGVGSGLYRSTDGGQTWTRLDNSSITGPICAWDPNQSGLSVNADLGRIGIAFAPSNPNRAYIEFSGANGPDKGFYVSNDAGQTWACGAGEPGAPNAGYEWVFGPALGRSRR
jgi:photosystem II stability/assembly factor-like uncharacterized protein